MRESCSGDPWDNSACVVWITSIDLICLLAHYKISDHGVLEWKGMRGERKMGR